MRAIACLVLAACGGAAPSTTTTPVAASGKSLTAAASLATKSEDITITVGTRTVPATVVAPTKPGPWPGIVLLAGSGPTDRDWNSPLLPAKNGSGKLLAEELAKHGAVVIRYDKAGVGGNAGVPITEFTLDTYRDEQIQVLATLRGRADVRKDRVFLAGHSEGGLHATRLALAAGADVAGVIYLASVSRSMAEMMLVQIEGQLRGPQAGLPQEMIASEMASLRAAFTDFLAGKDVDATTASKLPPLQQLVAQVVSPATAPLMRALLAFDNAAEAAKLTVPVLIVNGAHDMQIDPELDARTLHAAFIGAKRDATLHISPEADHVLKHETATKEQMRADLQKYQDAYNAPDRVLDADVVTAVIGWLAAHT
jgi:pimeloyl-ACP methyl ester carboxylesterase